MGLGWVWGACIQTGPWAQLGFCELDSNDPWAQLCFCALYSNELIPKSAPFFVLFCQLQRLCMPANGRRIGGLRLLLVAATEGGLGCGVSTREYAHLSTRGRRMASA